MRRTIAAAMLLCASLLLPATALGHAELVSADPAEGAEVEGPFFPIILTFSEALADGSKAEVAQAGGGTAFITILPDPADATRMAYAPSSESQQFSPGEYEIRWTSVAGDGDILRGTITFTVSAPPPTPSPSPSIEPSATPAPSPSASPSPSPTPAPSAEPGDGSGDSSAAIIPIIVALALVGAAAWWLVVRRRPSAP